MSELFAPTLNFVLFSAALVFFARKPLLEHIKQRRAVVKTQVDEAKALKAQAEAKYKEFSDHLTRFEAEAARLLDDAKRDGEKQKEKLIADAKQSAERVIAEAKNTAEASMQEFIQQIKRETVAQAVDMAEKILREKLSTDDQKRFVSEYVEKV